MLKLCSIFYIINIIIDCFLCQLGDYHAKSSKLFKIFNFSDLYLDKSCNFSRVVVDFFAVLEETWRTYRSVGAAFSTFPVSSPN